MSSKQSLAFGILLLLGTVLETFGFLIGGISFCRIDPCVNGKCVGVLLGYKCVCETGWVGATCNILDACDPNPCVRGICHNRPNSNRKYVCNCDVGYTGLTCQQTYVNVRPCRKRSCLSDQPNDGIDLEIRENCNPNPCANGECVNDRDGFQCKCNAGWMGKNCDISNYCDPNPCVNGECINEQNGYNCSCTSGWSGATCEIRNYCDPSPCVNGKCNNGQYGCDCSCSPGWSGKSCETRDYCNPNPCEHGSCSNGQGRFVCSCEANWAGETCANSNSYLEVGDF